jgi:Arylsulfotransferase (ASST)
VGRPGWAVQASCAFARASTATGDTSTYANGPEILDRRGNIVWFHAIPQGETASDFRTQTYRGRQVLTWWQTVINGVVQEINIATGKVLFQWNSEGHVPFGQSEQPLPASPSTPWDWFHINAVHLDTDGNLLIDARDTWTTYKVSLATGNVIWQLGGKDSSFTLGAAPGQVLDSANEIFAWQHDPEAIGRDEYTFFDNESSGNPLLPYSRAVTAKLDERTHVARLVASDNQPEGLSAASQGNAQTTRNGNLFVGWGALPYFSEFDPAGELIFNAELPQGVNTYRAYLLPWRERIAAEIVPGQPRNQPDAGWRSLNARRNAR